MAAPGTGWRCERSASLKRSHLEPVPSFQTLLAVSFKTLTRGIELA